MSKTMNTDANVKDPSEDDTNQIMDTNAVESDTNISIHKATRRKTDGLTYNIQARVVTEARLHKSCTLVKGPCDVSDSRFVG